MIGLNGDRLWDSGSVAAKLTLEGLPSASGGAPLLRAAKALVRIYKHKNTWPQHDAWPAPNIY